MVRQKRGGSRAGEDLRMGRLGRATGSWDAKPLWQGPVELGQGSLSFSLVCCMASKL